MPPPKFPIQRRIKTKIPTPRLTRTSICSAPCCRVFYRRCANSYWGAGKYSRVRAIEKCCFTASGIISVLSVFVIFFFPEAITNLFMPNMDAGFMETAIIALRLFSLTYLTRWFSFATQSYMLAVEKSLPASVISVSTALIFPVLLIVLLWPLGLTGIWLNFACTALLAAILSIIILRKKRAEFNQPDIP